MQSRHKTLHSYSDKTGLSWWKTSFYLNIQIKKGLKYILICVPVIPGVVYDDNEI